MKVNDVVKIDSCPHVQVIATNKAGEVLGTFGGDSKDIPPLLDLLSQLGDRQVVKLESNLVTIGQDCFSVSREFLFSFRGAFAFLPWNQIRELDRLIPDDAKLTIVVSY